LFFFGQDSSYFNDPKIVPIQKCPLNTDLIKCRYAQRSLLHYICYGFNPFYLGSRFNSTVVKLQIGWSQDQGPHKWALILAPASLPLELYFFKKMQKNGHFKMDANEFFKTAILYPRIQCRILVWFILSEGDRR